MNVYSTFEVMRIEDMITQDFFLNFIRIVWAQDRKICSLILGVNGLKLSEVEPPSSKDFQRLLNMKQSFP